MAIPSRDPRLARWPTAIRSRDPRFTEWPMAIRRYDPRFLQWPTAIRPDGSPIDLPTALLAVPRRVDGNHVKLSV